jgi:hypothetical protein
MPEMMLGPDSDLMCLPSEDGLIIGRMDHHFPVFWISGFAWFALKRAAACAAALGKDGSRFEADAASLRASLLRKAETSFGKNDRDVNSAFWPTGWATREDKDVCQAYETYWNNVRCPKGSYTREALWTYFEAGQAHNYLLMGQRERAWMALEHFLTIHTAPGLYTYSEGSCDENSFLLWQRTRGWDKIKYVTPHGWTAAEVFLLLRDCLAREENNRLLIGSGIPAAWQDKPFAVKNLPTYFGRLSYSYEPASRRLSVTVERMPQGGVSADLPFAVETTLAAG